MSCPNCNTPLTIIRCKNNLAIDHCPTCGGTFFHENEINRIDLADAKRLAKMRINTFVSGNAKHCPRDRALLAPMVAESIPQFVTLLQCDECRSIFAFPDDLLHFKNAQNAKINYFKTWQIPIPTLRSVLVFSFVIAISLSVFNAVNPFSEAPKTKASDDFCNLQIARVGENTLVYCSTKNTYTSVARLHSGQGKPMITRTVNTEPKSTHILTLTANEIANSEFTSVQFIFTSPSGNISTQLIPLQ